MEGGIQMPILELWNEGLHPITGYRINWHDNNARIRKLLFNT